DGKKCPEEDPTVISVTVGSTPMTPNPSVFIGPPALLGAGNYTVKCGGTGGGDFVWLVAGNTTSVNLANQSDQPQQWLVVAAVGARRGSYTIQNVGNSQYLNWSPLGVSLVGILGPGTTWQVTTMTTGMLFILVPGTAPQYLNGNTSDKAVNVLPQP